MTHESLTHEKRPSFADQMKPSLNHSVKTGGTDLDLRSYLFHSHLMSKELSVMNEYGDVRPSVTQGLLI